MKLQSINIENIGCIQSLSFEDLDPNMNVITGSNGVGKTTLLKSVCSILTSASKVNLKRNALSDGGIISGTLNDGGNIHECTQKLQAFTPKEEVSGGGFGKGRQVIYLSDNREFEYIELSSIPKDFIHNDNHYTYGTLHGIDANKIKGWFVNRYLFSAHPTGLTKSQYANFEHAQKAFSILDSTITFSRVDSHSLDIMLQTPSGQIYFEYLSSGFKSLIILFLGIIMEIEFRFGDQDIKVEDFDGIIIIDEIDVHLHPTWQTQIINILKKIFPEVQFFVSTHSPHVIQSLPPNQLIALEKVDNNIIRRNLPVNENGYIGWTIEEILRDVMGMSNTNSDLFQKLWNDFTKSIEEENTSEANNIGGQLLKILHPSNVLRKVIELHLTSLPND
ncbi:MAG: AAA family ATPase [Parabacteroides sp.]|nr:AAA family ATPase [Parabacteroides sp.]MDY4757485.1 AAA family ATPase [Parabacteroides sp.]